MSDEQVDQDLGHGELSPRTAPVEVIRLLQNPLGQPAPLGAAGDIVRVSDGIVTIYLTPGEYDRAGEADLRYLLAKEPSARRDPPRRERS